MNNMFLFLLLDYKRKYYSKLTMLVQKQQVFLYYS